MDSPVYRIDEEGNATLILDSDEPVPPDPFGLVTNDYARKKSKEFQNYLVEEMDRNKRLDQWEERRQDYLYQTDGEILPTQKGTEVNMYKPSPRKNIKSVGIMRLKDHFAHRESQVSPLATQAIILFTNRQWAV